MKAGIKILVNPCLILPIAIRITQSSAARACQWRVAEKGYVKTSRPAVRPDRAAGGCTPDCPRREASSGQPSNPSMGTVRS
jgi:hypothetical protein